jgi:hypothetical protein
LRIAGVSSILRLIWYSVSTFYDRIKMGKSGNPAKGKLQGIVSWFSNSPTAATGYGMQSNQVLNRMIRDGLDVAVLSNYGREGVMALGNLIMVLCLSMPGVLKLIHKM